MAFVDIAKDFLMIVSGQLDPHTSVKGEVVVESENRVSLFSPAHIQFAKYGRGPGKKPPLDPILEWIGREGIIFDGTDEMGTAFAIQASIGRNGTIGYVPNAPNALEEAVDSAYKEYAKELNGMVFTEINDKINQIWEDSFPKTQVTKM